MYTTLRQYQGIGTTDFDALIGRKSDVEKLIRQVPGFVSYELVRTADGMTIVTVCNDKAGTDESTKQVAAWIGTNMPAIKGNAPVVTGGESAFHFTAN